MLISMLQEIINLIFVGHLNNAEMMAGVGMGNMIQNMLGLSFFIGLNGALETLCS
jgi:Na+-driven multidrug efflux pump